MTDINLIHKISQAMHRGDLAMAARLRQQLLAQHPRTPAFDLDLAITNDYLDIITPTIGTIELAPDAHLDDVGD